MACIPCGSSGKRRRQYHNEKKKKRTPMKALKRDIKAKYTGCFIILSNGDNSSNVHKSHGGPRIR